jgi:predicted DNA binding protein
MTHFIGDFMKLHPSGSHPRAARLGLNVLGVRWDRSTGLSTTVLFEEDSALILNISMMLEPFLVEIEPADLEVRNATLREAIRLDEEVLTTLHVASTLGYFQDPRKVSLQHIADQLGVSSNTVNRRIRKAERMLVASILK